MFLSFISEQYIGLKGDLSSMKFILTMIMCTSVYNTCLEPFPMPTLYNTHYECMIAGYNKAIDKAKEIFLKILDDETTNKMPLDIIEEAKKNFNERLQNINWDTYYNDLPFNPSALSLYKWAPIAEELKQLDRKIVLNSVILKWDIVRKEFKERVKF